MITIFVSGVLINGEEIIKRDSREIVCSRRVTIKIENWVDPEARWKVTSDKRYRARIPVISYPCFGSNGYLSLSLSLRALIRKCSSLQVMCKKKWDAYYCYIYMWDARIVNRSCDSWKFFFETVWISVSVVIWQSRSRGWKLVYVDCSFDRFNKCKC